MIVISDTNILGSFAAAQALPSLLQLFKKNDIYIPPAVYQELKNGLERSNVHLTAVIELVDSGQIQILELSTSERSRLPSLPVRLNAGESEGIILAQNRQARFLCNDGRAVRYCKERNINVSDLPDLLRLLWIRRIVPLDDIRLFIARMEEVEELKLSEAALTLIFAPRKRRRRKR